MVWQTVFDVYAYICMAFGPALGLSLMFSESPIYLIREQMKREKDSKEKEDKLNSNPMAVALWLKLLVAGLVLGFLAGAGFLIYNNGNWNVNGLPLVQWVAVVVLFTIMVVANINPCFVCNFDLLTLSVVTLTISVIMTAFFFSVTILPAIFAICADIGIVFWVIATFFETTFCLSTMQIYQCSMHADFQTILNVKGNSA